MNDRILNLILNVQYNAGSAFDKVKQQLSGFTTASSQLLKNVNDLLQVMSMRWVAVVGWIGLGIKSMAGMHIVVPILGKINIGLLHALKGFAGLVVMFEVARRAGNWLHGVIEKIVDALVKMGHITEEAGNKIKTVSKFLMHIEDPWKKWQKSAEKLIHTMRGVREEAERDRGSLGKFFMGTKNVVNAKGETVEEGKGGLLPGVGGLFTKLLNPKVAAGFLAILGAFTAIGEALKVVTMLSIKWFEFTFHALTKITELAIGVGVALVGAFTVALKKGIEVSSLFEQMQVQMENVIKTSRPAGEVKDVRGEAKKQMDDIRKMAKQMPTIGEQDIVASVVQAQVLGTMDRLVNSLKGGGGKERLFKIIGDVATQFKMSPQEVTEVVSRGALGQFRGLVARFGINRDMAEAAGGGDPTKGMLDLLEKKAQGSMDRVRNTFDGAVAEIHKIWDEQFKDIFDNAFTNSIEPFVLSVRDIFVNLFNENKEPWKSAKATLQKLFGSLTDLTGTGILQGIKSFGEALMKIIGSPAVSAFIDKVHIAIQMFGAVLSTVAEKSEAIATQYMPKVAAIFSQVFDFAVTVFYVIINNIDNIAKFFDKLGHLLFNLWKDFGTVAIATLKVVASLIDNTIVLPIQGFLEMMAHIRRFQADNPISTLSPEEKKKHHEEADRLDKINLAIHNIRDASITAQAAMSRFMDSISKGKNPLDAAKNLLGEIFDPNSVEKASKQAKELRERVMKDQAFADAQRKAAGTEDKGDNQSVGERAKFEEDHLRTMIGLLNEMGNNQQALNILETNFEKLVGSARKGVEDALKTMSTAPNQDVFRAAFDTLIENINKLRESAKSAMDSINGLVNNIARINNSQMGFIDSIDRPMGAFYDQMVQKQQEFIQVEKTAAQFQMDFAMQIGDLNMYSDAYEKYLALLRQEIDLRDKQIERMFKYKKEGYDAIKGLIDAQKSYIEVLTSDQGPMADFQAKRQLMMEQLDVLKAQLAMQEEQLKIKEQQQEQEGGIYDKIVQQKTEIIKTKAEMMGIEKTLRNIANPSLLEQIVGAPQRVLAMLPSAKQLHDRARTAITEQMGGVQRTSGGFTILQVPQGMGMLPGMGTGGMVPNQLLGTKFFPYHTAFDPMKGLPGRGDIKDMINKVNTDQTNLPNRMPVPQVNMSIAPIVNVAVTSLGQQWAQISPMIYQMIVRAINQQQRDQSRYGNSMAPTQPYVNNTPPPAGFNPGAYGPGSTDTPTNSSRAPTYHYTNAGGMGGNGSVGVPGSDNGIPRLGQ